MQGLQLLRRNHPEGGLLPSPICLQPPQRATVWQRVYRYVLLSLLHRLGSGYSDFSGIYFYPGNRRHGRTLFDNLMTP